MQPRLIAGKLAISLVGYWSDHVHNRFRAAADGPHPVNDQLRAVLDAMPTLVWLAAPDGALVYSNRRWLEYTGLSAEQARGWGWTTAVHQDDINRLTGVLANRSRLGCAG